MVVVLTHVVAAVDTMEQETFKGQGRGRTENQCGQESEQIKNAFLSSGTRVLLRRSLHVCILPLLGQHPVKGASNDDMHPTLLARCSTQ